MRFHGRQCSDSNPNQYIARLQVPYQVEVGLLLCKLTDLFKDFRPSNIVRTAGRIMNSILKFTMRHPHCAAMWETTARCVCVRARSEADVCSMYRTQVPTLILAVCGVNRKRGQSPTHSILYNLLQVQNVRHTLFLAPI